MGKEVDKMRVGDVEREDAVRTLGAAMTEGRLDLTEYEQRLDAVWSSTTRGELAKVVDDLPQPATDPESSSTDWHEYFDEWRWWLGGAVVMNGIWGFQWLSDGEPNNYWPMWPLGIWAIILIAMVFMPEDKD